MERGLALEAGARRVAEADPAVLDRGLVGEAAEGLEHAGIGFAAAEGEAAGRAERQQVAAVGQEAARRPAFLAIMATMSMVSPTP